jgi:hypothetical protein
LGVVRTLLSRPHCHVYRVSEHAGVAISTQRFFIALKVMTRMEKTFDEEMIFIV